MERRTYDLPARGGAVAGVHFGRTSNPLKLVFLHANGFCAQSYANVLEPLGVHALAIDLRGHGRTTLPADPGDLKSWNLFRDDVVTFFDAHVDAPVMLAGHSLGAVTGILAARKLGKHIHSFVGFDPVLLPRAWRYVARLPGYRAYSKRRFSLARNAGRRRDIFESREAAFAHYQGRGAYKRFPEAVLRDYLAGGLRAEGDHFRLACAPAWEQAIFIAQTHDALGAARALPRFSRIVFAGRGAPHTPGSRKAMAKALGPDRISQDVELGHLFPFERPELATEVLRAALTEVGFARR